jgi:hypothetical protein
MESPRFDGFFKYRWPLLCPVLVGDDISRGTTASWPILSSPAPNPGNLAAKATVKIDGGWIRARLGDSGPKLELVPVTVAAMSVVATDRQVH